MSNTPADPQRLVGLIQVKLRGLVGANFGALNDSAEVRAFNGGAAVQHDGAGYVYVHQSGSAALGAALAWSTSVGVTDLHVMLDDHADVAARRATMLSPSPTVWKVDGTALELAVPTPHVQLPPDPAVEVFRSTLEDAGVEVIPLGLDLVAEVLGLEVARVTPDGDGGAVLRVGVGEYDQEAHAMMAGDQILPRLGPVVDEVRLHRGPAARPHPLNRLGRERWLRQVLIAQPELVGAAQLAILPDLEMRSGIKESVPTAARGTDASGASVLVVCAVGIDLALVPLAADYLAQDPADRVVLVIPERDRHDILDRLAALLNAPIEFASIPNPWPL